MGVKEKGSSIEKLEIQKQREEEEDVNPFRPASDLRSAVITDIFSIALKNLELGQARTLLREEVSEIKPSITEKIRNETAGRANTSYDLSVKLVRVCLYYDTALTTANSIFHLSRSLEKRVLSSFGEEKGNLDPLLSDEEEEGNILDPSSNGVRDTELPRHLARLYPLLKKFVKDKENMYYDFANLLNLLESKPSSVTYFKIAEASSNLSKKIDIICDLVQDYLKSADRYLTSIEV